VSLTIAATQALGAGTVTAGAIFWPATLAGGSIWLLSSTIHAALEGRDTPIDVLDKKIGTHFGNIVGWISGDYRSAP
jgi:hypothetical protein